jgi:tetratricopeptide (TPR) repeat protein
LITTREEPNLPKLRFSRYELRDGLKDADGAAVLRGFGILGTEAELVTVSQRVGGIPLSLMLIVGLLCNDYEEEPHVRFLPKDLFGIKGAHRRKHVVTTEQIFRECVKRLKPRLQNLLMAISVFVKPFDRKMAAAMVDEEVADQDLLFFKKRCFVLAENRTYRFQPKVQELVQRITADIPKLHRRAINFYLSQCEAKIEFDPLHDTIEDVEPYLQVFHHYCELGEYENAFYTIHNDLNVSDNVSDIDSFLALRGYYANLVALYTRLVKVWQRNKSKKWEYAASLTSLGNAYCSLGQYQQAIALHQKSLEVKQVNGDKKGLASSFHNLGSAYSFLGQYQQAITFHQTSLEIQQTISDKKGAASSLGGLGNAYFFLGQYQQAIALHQKSLEIAQEIGDKTVVANSLNSLGNTYNSLGQYQQAITFLQQSLEIDQEIGDKKGEASSLDNLGNVHNSLRQYQQAITFYQQSLEIRRLISDKEGEANSLNNLGVAYSSLRRYQQAITFYQQSLEIQKMIGNKNREVLSLKNLAIAYFKIGRAKEAFTTFYTLYKLIQLSLGLDPSLESTPYSKLLKSIILFIQRGK